MANGVDAFSLFGRLVLDDKEYNKGLEDSEKNTEKAGKKMGATFEKLGKGIAVFGGAMLAAGGAAFAAANKFADTTDRIDKMSQKVGLSREGFQEWDFIMSQSGGSVESLQMGMKTLSDRIVEASEGAGIGAESFKALGISQEELAGMSQEDIFELTVSRLQEMDEGAQKSALANDLLGKSALDMAPLINGAAGSIEDMKNKANELGLVIGDDAIDAGVKFTDQMDQIKRSLSAVGTQIVAELMPAFTKMADWVLANMPEIKKVMSVVFDAIGIAVNVVTTAFKIFLLPVLKILFEWVQIALPYIQKAFELTFQAITEVTEDVKKIWEEKLLPAFQKFYEFIKPVLPIISDVFRVTFGIIAGAIQIVINVFTTLFGWIVKVVDALKWFFSTKEQLGPVEIGGTSFKPGPGTMGGSFSVARANGGKVRAGQMYGVNERGRETFIPESDGVVLSADKQDIDKGDINNNYGDIKVTINAKDLKEMKDVTDFFNKIQKLKPIFD